MRRFTRDTVRKWEIGPTISLERGAKPFPGRWPTRVWIVDDKRGIDYFGKLGLTVFKLFSKFRGSLSWAYNGIRIYEFDRAGLVAYMDVGRNYFPLHLWQKYHPGRPGPRWDGLFLADIKPVMRQLPVQPPEPPYVWGEVQPLRPRARPGLRRNVVRREP